MNFDGDFGVWGGESNVMWAQCST